MTDEDLRAADVRERQTTPSRDLRADLDRPTLEKLMAITFGPDWYGKVLVGPTFAFPLRDVYDECGFEDPHRREDSGAYGLWQINATPMPRLDLSPSAQAANARRYIDERYGGR